MSTKTTQHDTPAETIDNGAPRQEGRHARWAVGVLAAVALVALFWPRSTTRAAPTGLLLDAGDHTVPLASRLAPVTLLHFWATWCAPCLEEVPALQRLEDEHADDQDFALVTVVVDDDAEKVEAFLGTRAARQLYDPDWKVARRYGTRKLPETYLIVDGMIVERFVGATAWDQPKVRRQIDEALASVREVAP